MKTNPEFKFAAAQYGLVAVWGAGGSRPWRPRDGSDNVLLAQQTASAEPTIPPGVSLTSWFDNGKGGQHVLQIREGTRRRPACGLSGIVATDTDCAPDAQGLEPLSQPY